VYNFCGGGNKNFDYFHFPDSNILTTMHTILTVVEPLHQNKVFLVL